MSSDDELGANNIVLERETQFIPRSDDDEVLWDVQEITAERGKKYKVRWVGTDPATGKPWAQSWVAKHDCTDKLVAEWKAKKKRIAAGKRRGRQSTTSRASGSSKRAGSSMLGKKTRPSTSEPTSSRLDSVEQLLSPPPKKLTTKRKQQPETPATTSTDSVQVEEQSEFSRPRKKQKVTLEILFPPISSDEDGDALVGPKTYAKVTQRNKNKVPLKNYATSLDGSDEDDSLPPKAKRRSVRRSDARSAGTVVSSGASDLREESTLPPSKTKTKTAPRRRARVVDTDALSAASQDEEPRPSKFNTKSTSKRRSSSEQNDDLSEKEVEAVVPPIKVGPPRNAKRRDMLRESGSSSKPVPSHIKPREDDFDEERVTGGEFKGRPGNEASPSMLMQQDAVNSPPSTLLPLHIPILKVLPIIRPRSPDLSPGARARLELFDRMIANASQPDEAPSLTDAPEGVPDDAHFNNDNDDTYGVHDELNTFDSPRPISRSPSKSKPKQSKLGTPNGLIVPETESSQSQSQPLLQSPSLKPPLPRDQSPRKPIDMPTIAVIAATVTPSSTSPQDLFPPPPRLLSYTDRPSKRQTLKPVSYISPNTFRSMIHAHSRVPDLEAPPSSIESFTSPKHVDKGKQKAVEEDQLQSCLSEREGGGESRKRPALKKITDSELRKKGKELFDRVQFARKTERQKKKKGKRLKAVSDIVNGTIPPPSKGPPLPSFSGVESTLEMGMEGVVDLSGGANSATMDTLEHSEGKPLSEKERERLRIELRQEEEESTQEAMGIYPLSPVKESNVMDGGDAQIPPPRSPKDSPFSRQIDVDHVEQPSTDLQLASVIVQASQEQRYEDIEIEPLLAHQPTSSPPRPIPENLTDSPKRKLGEALSLLNVKSEEIQRLERELADERKNLQSLKVEFAGTRQSSEPMGPVLAAWEAERAQWTQERSKWEKDYSEWQTQRKEMSEERASLSARVAELSDAVVRAEEVRVKLSELEAEREAWTKERDGMLNDTIQRSEELAIITKIRGEYDQDRSKWEAERTSWTEGQARWETERAALQGKQDVLLHSVDELTVKVESVTATKVSAERDRDFFREQYAQASRFVGSVREENSELESRVKIAEGQAQEGVAAIKALFEGRIKALQADIVRWKGLTVLLQEKDRRTNDELRLRAAQAPELGDLCARLNAENKSLKVDVRKLEQAQQRRATKRKKLYREIFALKKERVSLGSKLSQLVKMADSSTQETSHSVLAPPILEDTESIDPNDMEFLSGQMSQPPNVSFDEPALFPCMWRPQWRDQCQQIFDTKEDLERHLKDHFRDLLTQ